MSATSISRRRFLALAGAGLAAGGSYTVLSNRMEAVRARMPGAAPARPLRIALATDLHAPHDFIDAARLAEEVRAVAPDLLLIVGDAVQRRGDEHHVARFAHLEARLGKFAALGNWEHRGGCNLGRLRAEYERAGARLLVTV
jgi:predicted MPP superfamily phosphohydrolase